MQSENSKLQNANFSGNPFSQRYPRTKIANLKSNSCSFGLIRVTRIPKSKI